MLNGRPPWRELGPLGALNGIAKHTVVPPIPDTVSDTLQDVVKKCLAFNPKDRPTASELSSSPWFTPHGPSRACLHLDLSLSSLSMLSSIPSFSSSDCSTPSPPSKPTP
eukprot:NODE_8195_length_376_cov_7.927711_g8029_i0.p2 GENE.NODE_8195_length_376_cov_7.927711_g8029_i0~~NODE_8195_length_376_cov_7.927711_g8029_i0.p2  ORF type:complete len:124 (-),score=25.49 NODE_8195_length_376_cov_7.927711_g8029_i0:4-330(-)